MLRWTCPLCEDNTPPTFHTELEMVQHYAAKHQELLDSVDLSNLLCWSRERRMGITSCPLCSVSDREDSPVLIDHVLEHVCEFSLRALPWPQPVLHDVPRASGGHQLPSNHDDADRLLQWLSTSSQGRPWTEDTQPAPGNIPQNSLDSTNIDETHYVPVDEYFCLAATGESSKEQGLVTNPSTDFSLSTIGVGDAPATYPIRKHEDDTQYFDELSVQTTTVNDYEMHSLRLRPRNITYHDFKLLLARYGYFVRDVDQHLERQRFEKIPNTLSHRKVPFLTRDEVMDLDRWAQYVFKSHS